MMSICGLLTASERPLSSLRLAIAASSPPMRTHSRGKTCQTLDKPKRCQDSYCIGRDAKRVSLNERGHADPFGASQSAHDDAYENELPDLDPDIEGEQRQRNVAPRQADFRQRAGKAETVKQAERKRYDPWPPRGQARLT